MKPAASRKRKHQGRLHGFGWGPQVKMTRKDRQTVQRWLAGLHPYANKQYGLRNNREGQDYFPTNQAAIRRYFAWCARHELDPGNTKTNVSQPGTSGHLAVRP